MDTRKPTERRRHSRHLDALIDRLLKGPATAMELSEVAGLNYRARVSEARVLLAPSGVDLVCDRTGDVNVYRLVREPKAQLRLAL